MLISATNVLGMDVNARKAKVTPEHEAEAKALKEIWDAAPDRPSQAVFGERYEIGNQSAVGQFLRGSTPLSLKAARGFAEGLKVDIAKFSPRLADEASRLSTVSQPADQQPRPSSDSSDDDLAKALMIVGRALRKADALTCNSVIPSLTELASGPSEIGQIARHIVFLLSKSRPGPKPSEDHGKKGGFEDFDFTPRGASDGQSGSAEEQERGRGVRGVSGGGARNG